MKKIILLCLFVFFSSSAMADDIYLTNGNIVSGEIMTYTEGICIISSPYGILHIPAADIQGLSTQDTFTVTMISGEVIKLRFQMGQDRRSKAISDSFGEVDISIADVQTLVRNFAETPTPENATPEIGVELEESAPLDFLADSTVLLAPRSVEVEFGVGYRQTRTSYALFGFQRSSITARNIHMALGVRAGLWKGLEGWIRVPLMYTSVQDISTNEWQRFAKKWDIGDIDLGLQYNLIAEGLYRPAISASLGMTIPTGDRYLQLYDLAWKNALGAGSGHWGVNGGLSFVKTSDPVVLFSGIGYQYSFPSVISHIRVKPGFGVTAYAGIGFALNDKVSLSTRYSFQYNGNTSYERELIKGSFTEAQSLALGFSYRFYPRWVVSPQVIFGLNEDAGSPGVAANITRKF